MAFTAWTASTAFAVGDVRRATTVQNSGLVFRCTVAGTSSSSEPSPWPAIRGLTIEDGTCTWLAVTAVGEELNKLAPSAVIELFELDGTSSSVGDDQIRRFHAGVDAEIDGDIIWNGNTYSRYPVDATGFKYEGNGQLPRPQVSISNALGLASNLAILYKDFVGATFTRIRTLKKYLDDQNFDTNKILLEDGAKLLLETSFDLLSEDTTGSTADQYAEFPREIFVVDRKVIETRDQVTWELAATFDVAGVQLPKRQIVQNVCPWTYKGEGCAYSGSNFFDIDDNPVATSDLDVCSHRLSGCKARFGEFAELPYGGFPSVGLIG